MTKGAHFTPGYFAFFRDLAANNDRAWFAQNKARFVEQVEAPLQRFITDLAPRLRTIGPHFVADPRRQGGSMFRIHRDTRFSKDKTPYKTGLGAHFHHSSGKKGSSAPGFYLHLEPGECVGGGGIHQPEPAALAAIRDRIVESPEMWTKAVRKLPPLQGERLKRVPKGYDPEHPHAEALRHKDLYVLRTFTQKEVTSPDFLDTYVATCREALPLVRFVADALELDL